jgi:hypothetical protein
MTQWYYEVSGEQHGPISPSQLKQLATSGQLKPTDLVRHNGMQHWAPASNVIGLFNINPKQKQPPALATNVIAPPIITPKTPSYPTPSNSRRRKKKKHKLGKSILSIGVVALGLAVTLGGIFSILLARAIRQKAPGEIRALLISIENKEENAELKEKGEKMTLIDGLTVFGNTSGMTEGSIEEDRAMLQFSIDALKSSNSYYPCGIIAVVLGPVFIFVGIGMFLIVVGKYD